MASKKREIATIEQEHPQLKRPKYLSHDSSSSVFNPNFSVSLNPADCDLAFNIEADGLTGHALHEHGFAYCWSGARGTVGISGGKYYFGCKVVSSQPVDMEDTPPDQQNVCRIGISRGDDPVGNLGETAHSYGFGGTGKFSNAGRFVDYGERFVVGDTIICLVDLESKPWSSIEFCKNGRRLGIAKKFDSSAKGLGAGDTSAQTLPWESAFFPHVLLKNTVVEMQFSIDDGLIPIEGYKAWASAIKDEKTIVGPSLAEPTNCEVIMMVGLPASGKSTWAEKWVKEHPEKRCVLLGTNLALDQMKVPGLLRKNNYGERFDKLMERATGIFNTLLTRASKVPRNYIIDQTNVYKSARKRKLKPFAFYHKIAVVVFPRAEELKLRAEKRFKEMGKDVPPEAVNEMLTNFVLPMSKDMRGTDEYFDQVIFTELNRSEAQQNLDEMKRALVSSSLEKPRSDRSAYSSYSRENSVHSDSWPVPGQAQSRYSVPSAGVGGVATDYSQAGYPEPAAPTYTANVDTGYTGFMQPASVIAAQPYRTNVNARYESSDMPYHQASVNLVPARDASQGAYISHNSSTAREELTRYGGYMPDPLSTQPYGPLTALSNQSSCGPYGHQNPSSQGQYGASPYGQPNPRAYESYPAQHSGPGGTAYNPPLYESYPSSLQHPAPGGIAYSSPPYGSYPASVQHPAPGGIAYSPPPYGSYSASVKHPAPGVIAYDPPRYY